VLARQVAPVNWPAVCLEQRDGRPVRIRIAQGCDNFTSPMETKSDFTVISESRPRFDREVSEAVTPETVREPLSALVIQTILILLALAALTEIGFALWLSTQRVSQPDPANWFNVFYVLFARNEPSGLALIAAFAAATLLWFRRGAPGGHSPLFLKPRPALLLFAAGVLAVAAVGTWLVFDRYLVTADEYMAEFQARIFLAGKIHQEVPAFWQPMQRLILPTHGVYLPASHSWMSSYLPMYAALRALFMSVRLEWLTNAVLAATSIFAIAALARNIWPNDHRKPLLAAVLLGASPQFLIMAMTGYAMPAHLAFNLVWLWLYSDSTKRRFWLTPFVGVIALGLHQPFFHALFAIPFLARLVRQKRWMPSFWFCAIYVIGIVCWGAWWHNFVPALSKAPSKVFGVHPLTPLIQFMYLGLLLGWLALPLPLLSLLGLSRLREQQPLIRDAAMSCFCALSFYVFVRLDQAHGWGDRYFFGELGCLVLIAIVGSDLLAQKIGTSKVLTFVTAGAAASLLLQLPLRCVQAKDFVQPYVEASAAFQRIDADILAFEPRLAWYSADLSRNDPFLSRRPIVVSFLSMKEPEAILLQKTFPHSRIITEEEMERLQKKIAQ
jgi:hypothetical protein